MIRLIAAFFFILFAALQSRMASAKTITAQRISATQRLLPLQKITVGAEDQYHGSVDPSGHKIVYSQKADLIAHIQIQDLKTGDVQDLVPLTADSQEPTFGPDGKIAFTYYKYSARGDICYTQAINVKAASIKTLSAKQIHCLKKPAAERGAVRANPFWKSKNEIGYVTRDISSQSARLVSENIDSGEKQVLAIGKILTPAMHPGGRYLIYNQIFDDKSSARRNLVLKDLSTNQTHELRFALPGISGFPAVSDDERFIYFTHYLNDSNNDNVIDANDNAVIFRIPMQTVLAAKPGQAVFPEQLTSVENSCSLPEPFQNSVFATCAFEGSLDIYQIPATGIVPTNWNQAILNNALETSRSYQDRVLILNTLQYRQPASSTDEELLGNFLLADDTAAARYYLARLESRGVKHELGFEQLLNLYLRARDLKKSQPSEDVSPIFQKQLLALDREALKIHGDDDFRLIVRGFLKSFAAQNQQATELLARTHFSTHPGRPIELYLYFKLANRTWGTQGAGGFHQLLSAYRLVMTAPPLSEQARVYYAFRFLGDIHTRLPSKSERLHLIETFNRDLPPAPKDLLTLEAAILRLIQAPNDKVKLEIYKTIQNVMAKNRGDYFLRRALYVRAILNYSEAAEFKYMGFAVNAWLDDTLKTDTEFIFAREVFADASYDQAYAYLAKNNLQYAEGFFYEAVRLTDELEAHNGYIETLVKENKRKSLDDRYAYLHSHGFVDDNMKYVDALLTLIDAEPEMARDPGSVAALDKAIHKLESMQLSRDSSVRYLLLGYCYLEKFLRLSSGYNFSPELFQSARRNLMLAYDQARDNDRVKASALMDLGVLQQRAQNPGLSVKFFALRKPLGFDGNQEARSLFSWLYAKSLYEAHLPDRAAEELAGLPQEGLTPPILEHEAFYYMAAGKFKEAREIYGKLMNSGKIMGDLNLAKVGLSDGYVLFKTGKAEQAKVALLKAMEHAEHLKKIPKDADRLIDFQPLRLKLVGYGLLGQIGTPVERIDALEKRARLLDSAKDLIDLWLPNMIQNRLQLAALYSATDLPKAVRKMGDAITFTQEYGDANQFLGNVVFQATVDYLVHGILHPELYEKESQKIITHVVTECLATYDRQKNPPPFLGYQKLKLKILWAGYSAKVLNRPITDVNFGPGIATLKKNLPKESAELEQLRAAVLR